MKVFYWLVFFAAIFSPVDLVAKEDAARMIQVVLQSCSDSFQTSGKKFKVSVADVKFDGKTLMYTQQVLVDEARKREYGMEMPLDFVEFETDKARDDIIIIKCLSKSECIKSTSYYDRYVDKEELASVGTCDASRRDAVIAALKSKQ